ncbi:3D domain-containing protein [Patescibacteria group bacterium]|nr:3D domain-containing protein [Patescibacteria group bacterium]
MIIGKKVHTAKARRIIIAVTAILIWQVSFPQQVTAVEQNINDDHFPVAPEIQLIDTSYETFRLPINEDEPQPEEIKTVHLNVTAYSSTPDQTSGDPFITASGTKVHNGTIAANFLPIGTKVRFPDHFGTKIFVVEDRMSQRYWEKADIWMETREEAIQWGVQYIRMEII